MTDMIVKGTGNSRFLRSAIPADITFSQFVALLREGALPIDLAGVNDEGVEVKGTPLGKGTLLSDATETAIWGDAADRTVDEALSYSFSALMGYAGEKATVVAGTYVGDGTYISNSISWRTIALGFAPKATLICSNHNIFSLGNYGGGGNTILATATQPSADGNLETVSDGFRVRNTHYDSQGVRGANLKNNIYNYICIV